MVVLHVPKYIITYMIVSTADQYVAQAMLNDDSQCGPKPAIRGAAEQSLPEMMDMRQ
jgi:hypothetical protein